MEQIKGLAGDGDGDVPASGSRSKRTGAEARRDAEAAAAELEAQLLTEEWLQEEQVGPGLFDSDGPGILGLGRSVQWLQQEPAGRAASVLFDSDGPDIFRLGWAECLARP